MAADRAASSGRRRERSGHQHGSGVLVLESSGGGTGCEPGLRGNLSDAWSIARSARRQRALAELARLTLLGLPLPRLFHATTMAVAQGLGIEVACVLERLGDGRMAILRAGTGWMATLVDRTVLALRAWPDGPSGNTVLRLDTRRSPLFRRHGVRCGMAAVIPGHREPVRLVSSFGICCPGPHVAEFLATAAALVASAIERRRKDRERLDAISRVIRDEERAQIARDLHDEPLQALAAAALAVQRLRLRLDDPSELGILDQVDGHLRLAEEQMRATIIARRAHEPESPGELVAALSRLLAGLDADCGIRGELDTQLDRELPGVVSQTLYRVAREAVANVRRHAAAGTVRIVLSDGEDGVTLQVMDDGQGLKAAPGPDHIGLCSLHERVEAVGGRCRVTSQPGRGTTVECWLPNRPPRSWA
jgi:signal transduction histidine kinase